jgi:hypothetical protein
MRGVGIRPNVTVRSGQPGVQTGLTGIGWSHEAKLCGALGAHDMGRAAAAAALFGPGEFLCQLLDAGLDIGLQVVRALVLGTRGSRALR